MKFALISTVLVVSLTGCGGGSSDPGGSTDGGGAGGGSGEVIINPVTDLTGSYSYLGFFDMIQDNVDDEVDYDANFLQMTELQGADVFASSVPMTIDTCKLSITPTFTTDPQGLGFPSATFSLVSAGDTFTLTGTAGTYTTIVRAEDRFEVGTYPMPTPLSLDVPGAEFPAFSDVAIPDVEIVQNFQPGRNELLSASTTISWTPTGIENHTINLITVDIPASAKVVQLRCHVADDGSFALPDNIVSALDADLGSGWELEGMKQDKHTAALFISGDALLVVSKSLETL